MTPQVKESLRNRELNQFAATIATIGGTGNGKSLFTALFSDERADELFQLIIGTTNTTLRNRKLIYSNAEWLKDSVVVAIKPNEEFIDKDFYNNKIIIESVSDVIVNLGANFKATESEFYNKFKESINLIFNSNDNTKAVLKLLSKSTINEIIDKIVSKFQEIKFFQNHSFEIYNSAKNELELKDSKIRSNLLKNNVFNNVSIKFNEIQIPNYYEILDEINEYLESLFFEFFDKNNISKDGFYFNTIDLDKLEDSSFFIEHFFTDNNVAEGNQLSIEVLASEILIYSPLNDYVSEIISDLDKNERLLNKNGDITVCLLDSRGLFHDIDSDQTQYFQNLLYDQKFDLSVLLAPLESDTNTYKLREVYKQGLKNYKKNIPIVLLQNKVDLFIEQLNKPSLNKGRFSQPSVKKQLSKDQIILAVDEKSESLRLDILENAKIKSDILYTIPCALVNDLPDELWEDYNAGNAIKNIFKLLINSLELRSNYSRFEFNIDGDLDIYWEFNEHKSNNVFSLQLENPVVVENVFLKVLANIAKEMGKVIHGKSYEALVLRLKEGYGYSSNIKDESYYAYSSGIKNIYVEFPGLFKNILTDELLDFLISSEYISFKGGKFSEEDNAEILKLIKQRYLYYSKNKFTAVLLYDKALQQARANKFGYSQIYNEFLKNTQLRVELPLLFKDEYIEAFNKSLNDAIKFVTDMYVRYI